MAMQAIAKEPANSFAPAVTTVAPAATFVEMLAEKSRDRKVPKKERTRYLLFHIVACAIREDSGRYPSVEYVLAQSTLSRGTFYNHFRDIENCVFEMLSLFIDFNEAVRFPNLKNRTPYEAILDVNTWYCRNYEANANLFAVISNNPELGHIRAKKNAAWAKKIVIASERRRGTPYKATEKRELEGIVRILITMTIEALRDRFVHRDALMISSFRTSTALAVALSKIWHQSISAYERTGEAALVQ